MSGSGGGGGGVAQTISNWHLGERKTIFLLQPRFTKTQELTRSLELGNAWLDTYLQCLSLFDHNAGQPTIIIIPLTPWTWRNRISNNAKKNVSTSGHSCAGRIRDQVHTAAISSNHKRSCTSYARVSVPHHFLFMTTIVLVGTLVRKAGVL